MGSRWLTLCGTSDSPCPRSARKPAASTRSPVEPDAPRHRGVGVEQAQNRIGQKRLARARRAHHGHDLAGVHGDAQLVEHLHIVLFRLEVRRVLVVHAEAHAQVLNLQQVMPAAVA